jgi:hypothetical protein
LTRIAPYDPHIILDKEQQEITVGDRNADVKAWVYWSEGAFVILDTYSHGCRTEVPLMLEEVEALGKQLCKWARVQRRYERRYYLCQFLGLKNLLKPPSFKL